MRLPWFLERSCLVAALLDTLLAVSATSPRPAAVLAHSEAHPAIVQATPLVGKNKEQKSTLLQRSVKSHNPGDPDTLRQYAQKVALAGRETTEDGQKYLLTPKELQPIDSIHCLQEKQRNPHAPCPPIAQESYGLGYLSIGHYPTWREAACHSNGEFFCDPTQLLTNEDSTAITDRLHLFKTRNLVNCGQLKAILDPDAERTWFEKKWPVFQGRLGLENYRQFNLAVVLADEWPSSERDPRSMQYFGRVLMSQWGLMPQYNGVDNDNAANEFQLTWSQNHETCPNAAILVILPRYHDAFLVSPSCEFICASRGGPEVIAAALAGLDRGGLREAALAGIDEANRVLGASIPMTLNQPSRWHRHSRFNPKVSDEAFVWGFRALYIGVVLLTIISVVAFIYYLVLPEKATKRAHGFYLRGADGRQAFAEEGVYA